MILADTSVWVEHIRAPNALLQELLLESRILAHPFVLGEIACGNLRNRREFLDDFGELPSATVADHMDALHLLETRQLWGKRIGWVDVHLLASALLTNCELWTLDTRLNEIARSFGLDYSPVH